MKLCECGCGEPAPIARQTETRSGHVIGKPMRFIYGHCGRVQPKLADDFWASVQRSDNASCWPWLKSTQRSGYGRLAFKGSRMGSHQIAWILVNGPIGNGLCVLHKCDNPTCCNPSHLFLGTNNDNIADRMAKGRSVVGSKHKKSKLTEETVRQAREDRALGLTYTELEKKYGVTRATLHAAISGEAWRHIL